MKVKWSRQAAADLDAVVSYLFELNPAAALNIESDILQAAAHLAHFPEMGRLGQVFGTREWVVHPNYIIVYRITEPEVKILAVVHTRQKYPKR